MVLMLSLDIQVVVNYFMMNFENIFLKKYYVQVAHNVIWFLK